MAPTEKKAPDWREILETLLQAEKEAKEWQVEADQRKQDVVRLKAALMRSLKVTGGGRAQALVAEALGAKDAPRTRDVDRQERVLKIFADRGGFVTLDELVKLESCSRGAAASALYRLCKEGRVRKLAGSRGRYGLVQKPAAEQ